MINSRDLDALLARLNEYVKQWDDFDHGTWPECRAMREAAAALVQLREQRDEWHKAWIGMEKRAERAEAHIAALEAERDAMRDLLRRLRQWDMLSEGNTPRLADRDYWCEQIDAAIDAAREQK